MKNVKINTTKRWHFIKMLMISSLLIIFLSKCEKQKNYKYEYGNPGGKLGVSAWTFIQQTDSMSLMKEAVTDAGFQNYYSGSTEYTFIVPRNSAFRNYMKTKKYDNISAIPLDTLKNLLKYHLVKAKVLFSDPALLPSNNPIAYPTENGQVMYLSHNSSYQGVINQGTRKSWTIITSNLEPTNGVMHVTADVVFLSL